MNNIFKYIASGIVALSLLLALAVPVYATVPGLKEVCQRNTRGTWSWGLRSVLTGDMFLYAGPVSDNVNVKNAWCNQNAPSPSPVVTLASAPLFPKTICHHTPGNKVTHTFQNWQSYSGHLGTPHNNQTYDTDGPCPTATPTASPTASPTSSATPTSTASPSPSNSPSPSPTSTVEPTSSPSPVPTATPSQSSEPRADLSDGRSDGKTDSLGCQKPSDNCNVARGGTVGGTTLPSTGGGVNFWFMLLIPALAATLGVWMLKSTSKNWKSLNQNETSSENQTL
jgi:hypothetical protein